MNFGDLRVHTMTCTCRSGVRVSNAELEEQAGSVNLTDGDVGVVFCTTPMGVRRGPVPEKRGRPFGYNASMGVRIPGHDRAVHVKLFSSGTMQIAGALDTEAAYAAAQAVSDAFGHESGPVDLVVHMINASTRAALPSPLDLAACHALVRSAGLVAAYDPCRYSALKVSVFFSPTRSPGAQDGACGCASPCIAKASRNRWCHMATVSLFSSGAVGVSGGSTVAHLARALELAAAAIGHAPSALQRDSESVLSDLRRLKGRTQ